MSETKTETKTVRVLKDCYDDLKEIANEISERKKADGRTGRTTFGEVVCILINFYKEQRAA